MGLIERSHEKQRLKTEAAAQAAHDHWQAQLAAVQDRLTMVGSWFGFGPEDPQTSDILTCGSERVYLVLDGAALIEPRRAPGHFQGGSQGVSVHIAKGVNYRVGAMKGHYVPGPESPTAIDVGRVVVTDQQVTFAGQKASREWVFSKLIGCQHDQDNWTVLSVSNRQKVSGFGYDAEHASDVVFRLDLAIATAAARRPAMQQVLETQRSTLVAQEPPSLAAGVMAEPAQLAALSAAREPSALPPAGWYPDSANRQLQRYWDGTAWTEQTSPR